MTKALVTGGTGFAGRFLVRHLAAAGVEVHATSHGGHEDAEHAAAIHPLDVRSSSDVMRLVRDVRPDEIHHLAGITRPASGDVAGFYDVNLGGARNLLEAQRTHAPDATLLLVGSAYAYAPSSDPINELWPTAPHNHYGASKAAAEMLGRAYAADGVRVVLARPFNHSGPGQPPDFVLPTIVQQVARAMARGDDHVTLELGNLDSVRDICDVRDVAAAYVILARSGVSGDAYNVGSGTGRSIEALARLVGEVAGVDTVITQHGERVRANDVSKIVADVTKLTALGWQPSIELPQTIADMLDAARVITVSGV